mmetsp:Transcript_11580/g.29231  ORF Transcript_11580/g.29231 Transcript_11580/m.29231 type:complete len:142 (+) Transcript_11580:49-474(+)|eukprot:CAMPEP_0177631632 /NCGR_PEP_ID=MMETSP0447-20121125/1854_1 /TAXON_ID=0 /ORGANISM="Stygamoeba regulata, Strain BSH-02190019" /LENGTH=141 /DNA_ID=CAMNT_0019133131 /DNA_START=45 /DNA_END=470 /DNA_ORIENTATION=-
MVKLQNIYGLIALACVLSVGIILNILACALFDNNWWLLFVVLAYVSAPIPDILVTRCRCGGDDDFESVDMSVLTGRVAKDAAYFTTGALVISGLALPLILAHTEVISLAPMIMSLCGGLLVYGAILVYLKIFHDTEDDEDE